MEQKRKHVGIGFLVPALDRVSPLSRQMPEIVDYGIGAIENASKNTWYHFSNTPADGIVPERMSGSVGTWYRQRD